MKNTLKRLGALLIAAIMMIVMCVPVMARTTETALKSDYPTSADSAEVTVSGFEKGQVKEVWAYRIVDAEYDKNGQIGFSGYVAVKDLLREATEQNPKSSDRIPIFGNVSVKDASGNEKYTYTVTETNDQLEGYLAPTYSNTSAPTGATAAYDKGTIINQQPGVELPTTGGPGTRLFTLFGVLLISLSGAVFVMKRRRSSV